MSSEYDRLIEAARAVVKGSLLNNLAAALRVVDSLPPASPAPAPAKGVRCWRHENGPKWFDGTDRVRLRADGRCEWVWPDGRTELCIGVYRDPGYWQDRVVYDDYVECPDATYVATPPAPTEACPAQPAPAVESAEAVAERITLEVRAGNTWTDAKNRIVPIISARDSALTAARDAEIERLSKADHKLEIDTAVEFMAKKDAARAARDATIKDLNDEVRVLKGQLHMANEDYEMASAERNDLRAKLAAQPAAGVDKELRINLIHKAVDQVRDSVNQSPDTPMSNHLITLCTAIDDLAALAGGKA